MKKWQKGLVSGFLSLSMALAIVPTSVLANNIQPSAISIAENAQIPTEMMVISDKGQDGKTYQLSAGEIGYSPKLYFTGLGYLSINFLSNETATVKIKLHKIDENYNDVVIDTVNYNLNTNNITTATFTGLSKYSGSVFDDKYYFEIENLTGTDITGAFFINTYQN